MTAKQIRFCEEYLIDLNATQAAIRAGYSEESAGQIGHENLKKHEIIAYVEKRQQAIADALEITPEWVVLRFKEISDRSMQAIPVYDKEGNETGEFQYDSSGANKATEMLGKYLNLFTQKVDITSKGEPIKTAIVTLPNGGEIEI